MSLLNGIQAQDVVEEQDILGGYQPFESGVVEFTIKQVYLDEAGSGAVSTNFIFEDAHGKTLRSTEYITSGIAKGRKNYYEKDGKKRYLPGFNMVNSISLLTIGKELHQLTPQKAVLKIYDRKEQKQVPKEMETLSEMHGTKITIGLVKEIVDRVDKAADGSWQPTGETRIQNSVNKVFRTSDKMTVAEIKAQVSEATFINDWKKKYDGQTLDNATRKATIPAAMNPLAGDNASKAPNPFKTPNPFETPPPQESPDIFKSQGQ